MKKEEELQFYKKVIYLEGVPLPMPEVAEMHTIRVVEVAGMEVLEALVQKIFRMV